MKVETIYFLERVNKGNYEHMELSATAKVEDGEDAVSAMLTLKTLVNAALTGKIAEMTATLTPVAELKEAVIPEEVKEEKPKQTRTRKAKEEVKAEEVPTVDEVATAEVKELPKKKVKLSPYSAENKAVLQAYLTKKYGEAWKTFRPKPEIIEFTSKLPGMDFLDEEGNIIESFLNHINGFFGE